MFSVDSDWQTFQSSGGIRVLLLDFFLFESSHRLTTGLCGYRWSRRSPGSSAKWLTWSRCFTRRTWSWRLPRLRGASWSRTLPPTSQSAAWVHTATAFVLVSGTTTGLKVAAPTSCVSAEPEAELGRGASGGLQGGRQGHAAAARHPRTKQQASGN